MGENWAQAPNLSKIADILARTFSLMGKCRFPSYIPEIEAEERLDIWRTIEEEWMVRNAWPFVGPKEALKGSRRKDFELQMEGGERRIFALPEEDGGKKRSLTLAKRF